MKNKLWLFAIAAINTALIIITLLSGCASATRVDLSVWRNQDSLCLGVGVRDTMLGFTAGPFTRCWDVFGMKNDTLIIDTTITVTE